MGLSVLPKKLLAFQVSGDTGKRETLTQLLSAIHDSETITIHYVTYNHQYTS
jgi:hypothetical protein